MQLLKKIVRTIIIRRYASDAMIRAWESERVIPDVLAKVPKEELKVEFNDIEITHGQVIKPRQAKSPPKLTWTPKPNLLYTAGMVDPDAPSRSKPSFREWVHWLVVNIPNVRVDRGEVLCQYIGAGPPKSTGLHRYVILLYEQPHKINFENEPRLTNTSIKGRPGFCIEKFSQRHDLGQPVAGNFFMAEWDDYVPELYKQIGLTGF